MNKLLIGTCCLMLMSASVMAQPTTAPSTTQPMRRGMGGRGGMSLQDRQQTLDWARQNMPKLYELMMQTGGRGNPRRQAMMNVVIMRKRSLEMPQMDPSIRERIRKNIRADDQVADYVLQLQATPAVQRGGLQQKMHDTMKQSIEDLMSDRADRIAKLRAKLEQEEAALAADRKNIDQLVEQRLSPFSAFISSLPASVAPPIPSAVNAIEQPGVTKP